MKKPTHIIDKTQALAFIMSPRLGDSLIAMVVVNNLKQQGYNITVFSNHLFALKDWFSSFDIFPYPEDQHLKTTLTHYDVLIHTYPHDALGDSEQWHANIMVLDDYPCYRDCRLMVDIQVAVCEQAFGLTQITKDNGMSAPEGLQHRCHEQRVILHPTAFLPVRHWLPKRFVCLAKRLIAEDYQPVFIIAPADVAKETWIQAAGLTTQVSPSLDGLARWMYQSGWFIGNDSGMGHLASSLGIPTITLMQRPKVERRWRPGWAPGRTLLPSVPLLVRTWKERFWKHFISVAAVMRAFKVLKKDVSASG